MLSTSKLFYNAERRELSIDASELKDVPMYNLQSCVNKVGYLVVSHRTGLELRFFENRRHVNDEGEIEFFEFLIVPEDCLTHPHLQDISMIVYND